MFKLLLKLRDKYPLKTRIIFWLSLLVLASAGMNASLMYDKYNIEPKIITREIPIEEVVTVTKIITKVTTIKTPIEVMKVVTENIEREVIIKDINKTASENLSLLENGRLNITMESFEIIEDNNGKIKFPETIHGTANLEYLYYDLSVDLKPQIKYRKNLWDLRIMLGGYVYMNPNGAIGIGSNYFLQKNFKLPFRASLPLISDNVNLGLGFSGVTLTRPVDFYRGLKVDLGGFYSFSGQPAVLFGFSVKL